MTFNPLSNRIDNRCSISVSIGTCCLPYRNAFTCRSTGTSSPSKSLTFLYATSTSARCDSSGLSAKSSENLFSFIGAASVFSLYSPTLTKALKPKDSVPRYPGVGRTRLICKSTNVLDAASTPESFDASSFANSSHASRSASNRASVSTPRPRVEAPSSSPPVPTSSRRRAHSPRSNAPTFNRTFCARIPARSVDTNSSSLGLGIVFAPIPSVINTTSLTHAANRFRVAAVASSGAYARINASHATATASTTSATSSLARASMISLSYVSPVRASGGHTPRATTTPAYSLPSPPSSAAARATSFRVSSHPHSANAVACPFCARVRHCTLARTHARTVRASASVIVVANASSSSRQSSSRSSVPFERAVSRLAHLFTAPTSSTNIVAASRAVMTIDRLVGRRALTMHEMHA